MDSGWIKVFVMTFLENFIVKVKLANVVVWLIAFASLIAGGYEIRQQIIDKTEFNEDRSVRNENAIKQILVELKEKDENKILLKNIDGRLRRIEGIFDRRL